MNDEKSEMYLGPAVVDAIVRIGRAQERLRMILNEFLPDSYSKHDPNWHSEFDREGDLLDDARRKFNCLHDNLWDLMAILQPEGE
jgi:hypothetical protein